MIKYYCDACKKEITDWDGLNYRVWKEGEGDYHIEVCKDCHEKILEQFKKIGVKL